MRFAGKHVLITGGSEGLGLAMAKQMVADGAMVSLVARDAGRLEVAKAAVHACCPAGRDVQEAVFIGSADVTRESEVEAIVSKAIAALGPVDVLVACAGAAECGYFHELDTSSFQRMMDLNYFGVLYAVKAVYPSMVARDSGQICLIASTMSLLGFIGYSAYAPSKFALRGLAEVLRNEVQGTHVQVSIAFPPDIDTPGYAKENLNKPWECKKLSEGTLNTPDQVARCLLKGLQRHDYMLPNPVFKIGLLQTITQGIVPRRLTTMLWQMLLGLVAPVVCWITAAEHDAVARQGAQQRFMQLRRQGN